MQLKRKSEYLGSSLFFVKEKKLTEGGKMIEIGWEGVKKIENRMRRRRGRLRVKKETFIFKKVNVVKIEKLE